MTRRLPAALSARHDSSISSKWQSAANQQAALWAAEDQSLARLYLPLLGIWQLLPQRNSPRRRHTLAQSHHPLRPLCKGKLQPAVGALVWGCCSLW